MGLKSWKEMGHVSFLLFRIIYIYTYIYYIHSDTQGHTHTHNDCDQVSHSFSGLFIGNIRDMLLYKLRRTVTFFHHTFIIFTSHISSLIQFQHHVSWT